MDETPVGYNLAHPLYLDVPMMESFLAHLEGGLVKDADETARTSGARERLMKGRAGLRAKWMPVSGDLDAEGSAQRRDESSTEATFSRHHTDASLFNLLHEYLIEDDQVTQLESAGQLAGVRPGHLVELLGEYLGNPLEEALAVIKSFAPYVLAAREEQAAAAAQSRRPQRNRSSKPAKRAHGNQQVEPSIDDLAAALDEAVKNEESLNEAMGMRVVLKMAEDIETVPVHDLLLRTDSGLKAVLTVSSTFFSAATNEYLRAGDFRVVGKVTRVVTGERTINLTRRTMLGAANATLAQEILAELDNDDLSIRPEDPIVTAPAIQVLPMAIFI